MVFNQNEKYLLKFVADSENAVERNCDFIGLVYGMGIKIDFKNINPVNQIIDELDFKSRYKAVIGK